MNLPKLSLKLIFKVASITFPPNKNFTKVLCKWRKFASQILEYLMAHFDYIALNLIYAAKQRTKQDCNKINSNRGLNLQSRKGIKSGRNKVPAQYYVQIQHNFSKFRIHIHAHVELLIFRLYSSARENWRLSGF